MSERTVGMEVGRASQIVPFTLELGDDWVHVSAIKGKHFNVGCRALCHLHFQYLALGTPHKYSLAKDNLELEYIDSISVPRVVAEDYLFPKLGGLADQASEKQGIH